MLQKSLMTEQVMQNCIYNLTTITCMPPIQNCPSPLPRRECRHRTSSRSRKISSAGRNGNPLLIWLGCWPGQKTREKIQKEKRSLTQRKQKSKYLAVVNWKSSHLQMQFKELKESIVQRNYWQVHIWELLNENSTLDSTEIKACQMLQGFDVVQQG